MEIRIAEDNWVAELLFSPMSDMIGHMHCEAHLIGKTKKDALDGAQFILELFAKGRHAFIRVSPEAETENIFDPEKIKHIGFVRFSFKCESGIWYYPESTENDVSLSYMELQV